MKLFVNSRRSLAVLSLAIFSTSLFVLVPARAEEVPGTATPVVQPTEVKPADTKPAEVKATTEEVAGSDKKWNFEITPYLFLAGLNGTVGFKGNTADVNETFSDLKDMINKAFMGTAEVSRGRFFGAVDGFYIKLVDDPTASFSGPHGEVTANGTVNASVTEQIYTPIVGYRVLDDKIKVDALAGARYTSLETELDLIITTNIPELPGVGRSGEGRVDWWDEIVGARVTWPFLRKFSLVGYGDIGGGGSNITYQGVGLVKWQIIKNVSVSAGYRALYQDYKNDTIEWDMTTSGAILGVGVNF